MNLPSAPYRTPRPSGGAHFCDLPETGVIARDGRAIRTGQDVIDNMLPLLIDRERIPLGCRE